jgi:hypothetical protein
MINGHGLLRHNFKKPGGSTPDERHLLRAGTGLGGLLKKTIAEVR